MIRKVFFFISLFVVHQISSQTTDKTSYKALFTEGSYLIEEGNYLQALVNLKKAYQIDSTNANINFLMGECYLHSNTEKYKAEYYLSKAITDIKKKYSPNDPSEKAAPPHAYLSYGQALHINYKFDEAIQNYDNFLKLIGPSAAKEWQAEVTPLKNQSVFAKKMVANPINVKIINLGDSINSPYPDYSPVITADERILIFTTRRPNTRCSEIAPDGYPFEDLVISYKDDNGRWSKPVPLSDNINTCDHEASINLTPDGQTLILFKDIDGGNIYYSQWDGKQWSSLQEFGSDVNSPYWESHACLSLDGQILYFVSDRPGGYGGKDIYRVVKLPNGQWSKALNLGPVINTPYDEDGVFMHPDGKTLFFSSNGHQSMGGYDIFFSIYDEEEGKFSEPFNIGYPINTPDDDVFYVTSPDGKRAYYSSVKEGGYGEKDIYMITIPESPEKNIVLYKGKIVPAEGENLSDDISIIVTDKESGEIVGIYKPQKNGNFVFILKPGKEYNISYEANGEKFYEDEIYTDREATYKELSKALELEPIKLLGKVSIKKKEYKINLTILDNPKTRKPASQAHITIIDNKGNKREYTIYETNKGVLNDLTLQPETQYTINISADNLTQSYSFKTDKEDKAKTFSKVFYVHASPSSTAGETKLTITVLNQKLKKPLANTKVILKDKDGNKEEFITNEKGVAEIKAEKDKIYEMFAVTENGATSNIITLNLKKVKDNVIKKTLFIHTSESITATNTASSPQSNKNKSLPPSKYEFYFTYLKYAVDTTEEKWIKFIEHIVNKSQTKNVYIYIESSASRVPTLMGNSTLAKLRGERLKDKIIKAVEAKNGHISRLKFQINSKVQGPSCNLKRKDQENKRSIFEKYQYVKATAK